MKVSGCTSRTALGAMMRRSLCVLGDWPTTRERQKETLQGRAVESDNLAILTGCDCDQSFWNLMRIPLLEAPVRRKECQRHRSIAKVASLGYDYLMCGHYIICRILCPRDQSNSALCQVGVYEAFERMIRHRQKRSAESLKPQNSPERKEKEDGISQAESLYLMLG